MRKEPEHFGGQEMCLIYLARKLDEALRVETVLTDAGFDYAVEADRYWIGVLFRRERVGAHFYVLPEVEAAARDTLQRAGFKGVSIEPAK
jgi:hypothetical protein